MGSVSPPDHEPLQTGDRRALDHLFSVTYDELRRLAASVKRSDPNASLTPTTLVNEAWLKLAGSPELASTSPLHFKRIAARAMRQVLIEAARRRQAEKRGGKDVVFVTFEEALNTPVSTDHELLTLREVLRRDRRVYGSRRAAHAQLRRDARAGREHDRARQQLFLSRELSRG